MKKSSTSKSKMSNDPQLSIDLKPFCSYQSNSDSGDKLLKFGNQKKTKQSKSKNRNIDDPVNTNYGTSTTISKYKNDNDDYYSVKSNEDSDYSESDSPNIRVISLLSNQHHSHHHQNRRHHLHQHRHQHRLNSQSSKQHNYNYYDSWHNKSNQNYSNVDYQKEIENNFDNDYNYQKIPYKNGSMNDNFEGETNTASFEDVYQFTCKQINDYQIKPRNIIKKPENNIFYNENYPSKVVKTRMIFHDSDQLDNSLNLFIEEEEYYENKRRSRKKHHKKHKQRSASPNEGNTSYSNYQNSYNAYNKPQRKPLNQNYQKYMMPSNKNEYAKKSADNNFSDEYSIIDTIEKSPPSTHTYQPNNYATITFSNPRNEIPLNMKFAQSEEISSQKINDYLGSSDDQENSKNESQKIPDLEINEDINLKITVKDANENNQEKVHEFNIYSLKDNQTPNNLPETIEFEEEEEDIENDFIEIKDEVEGVNKKLKFHFEAKIPQADQEETQSKTESPNSKTDNSSKSTPNSKVNDSNKSSPNTKTNTSNKSSPNSRNNINTNNSPNSRTSNNTNNSPNSKVNNNTNSSPNSRTNNNTKNSPNSKTNNNIKNSPNTKNNNSNTKNNPNSKTNDITKSNPSYKTNNNRNNPNSKSNSNTRNSPSNKNNNTNNIPISTKNKINNNNNEDEESENDVASFCDVSTSFDSDVNKNEPEIEEKKYKTAEVSVTLRDIKETINKANKFTRKRKKSPRNRNQSDESTIVTTHRRRMKRSSYRKTLVHKSVQTDKVDNPTMTLAMLTSY